MTRTLFAVTLVAGIAAFVAAPVARTSAWQGAKPAAKAAASAGPTIVLETTKGIIEIETFPDEAPKSVARILELARSGFYRGQRFHWVQGSVIQIGDPMSRDMTKQDDWGKGGSGPGARNRPVGVAETSKRKFERGSVGLAYRANEKPESADSQIFILRAPNPALNGKYALIGRVTKGLEVADKIERADVIKMISVR